MIGGLRKYVFIQNDPFYLPGVLDRFLHEFHASTVGVNVQSVAQGGLGLVGTALALLRVYGLVYFQWKLRKYVAARLKAKLLNDLLSSTRRCYSVAAVAKRYGVEADRSPDVNSRAFRMKLREKKVQLLVSISGTQFYGRELRCQCPKGIINCHGGLLPKYRGLMPSFWTLANGEREGGVTVHYVDGKIDNGPILLQRRYTIHPRDTLEEVMARGKDLAAEALIDAVRLIESDSAEPLPNPENEATYYGMPTRRDAKRFRESGHRFF